MSQGTDLNATKYLHILIPEASYLRHALFRPQQRVGEHMIKRQRPRGQEEGRGHKKPWR